MMKLKTILRFQIDDYQFPPLRKHRNQNFCRKIIYTKEGINSKTANRS